MQGSGAMNSLRRRSDAHLISTTQTLHSKRFTTQQGGTAMVLSVVTTDAPRKNHPCKSVGSRSPGFEGSARLLGAQGPV